MTTLEDLWYGNIQPQEQDCYRLEEHKDLVRLFERVENQLKATFNDSQKEELEKLKDLIGEMQLITECGAFIAGFRLGVQLMAESLTGPPASRG